MGRYLFHCIDGIFHGNRIVSAKRGVLFLLSGILSGIFSLPDHKCCLLYTSMDMEVSSVKKKFKDKRFAAGCSRDVIKDGAEMLGWELTELFDKTIQAMRSCEASAARECGELAAQ